MGKFVLDDDNLYGNNALTDRQTDRQTANAAREDRGEQESVEVGR